MPAPLRITKKLSVTPLLDSRNDDFALRYSCGLRWSLYGEYEGDKPVPDSYLVENLKHDAGKGFLDGQHDDCLPSLGFYFGMLHGGILSSRTGQLRPDVIALQGYPDDGTSWYYSIGCILGNPSAALFPATAQEWQQWDADYRLWQARMSQERDTELLKPAPAIEYTV